MAAPYRLSSLAVTYTAKLKPDLVRTIGNLKAAIDAADPRSTPVPMPMPQRLPRRAWRVWYLKSPFRDTIRKKHYVFQDWRYRFTFKGASLAKAGVTPVISSVLGSATKDTSSTVDFAWHFPGTEEFPGSAESERLISRGYANFLRRNAAWLQEKQGGWRQQYAHWNFKQYVPSEQRLSFCVFLFLLNGLMVKETKQQPRKKRQKRPKHKLHCEYCRVTLTHRSLHARRQHEHGKKHIQHKVEYWQRVAREENLKVPDFVASLK